MQKRLTAIVALAIAAVLAVAATATAVKSPTLTGPDGNTQNIDVTITPKKLSKKKQTPVTLNVKTETSSTTNANGVPSPAIRAVLDFDRDTRINAKGLSTCDPSKIENTSTEEALRFCKNAKIGGGVAHALLPVGTRVFNVEQTVTAFNGKPQGGKPMILLHSYGTTPVTVSTVLSGPVTYRNKEGYGPRLDLTIPLLGGGQGALIDFQAKIHRTFRFKGRKVSYISSTCKDKKLKSRGEFVFRDGVSLTPKLVAKCAQKK